MAALTSSGLQKHQQQISTWTPTAHSYSCQMQSSGRVCMHRCPPVLLQPVAAVLHRLQLAAGRPALQVAVHGSAEEGVLISTQHKRGHSNGLCNGSAAAADGFRGDLLAHNTPLQPQAAGKQGSTVCLPPSAAQTCLSSSITWQ